MTRQLLYVACPLAPSEEEIAAFMPRVFAYSPLGTVTLPTKDNANDRAGCAKLALQANLQRALRWLAWLRKSFPETTFIAPWIASVMSGEDDSDPAQREAGLVDDCAVVERCDGIVLCGGRISSGMRREMEHGIASRADLMYGKDFEVYDLSKIDEATRDRGTWLGGESRCPTSWNIWAECFRDDGEPEGLGR